MGVTRTGRFALLTNYREKKVLAPAGAPSRGLLVRDFLLGHDCAPDALSAVAARGRDWAAFNLIVGQCGQAAWYYSNRDPSEQPRPLANGRYVLSNHLLDTPWPKVQRVRVALDAVPGGDWARDPQRIFDALHDTTPANDQDLPETGLDRDAERLLSSPFIISENYGTRCSTLLACDRTGKILLSELSYDARGTPTERHDWPLDPAASR